MLCAVVAIGENNVIGHEGTLPWRLPDELAYFKKITLGRAVIMGRRTFEEELGKPLPGRTNIVVTRNPDWSSDGVVACHSLDAAIDHARDLIGPDAWADPDRCPAVLGGGQIYAQALPRLDRIYLTLVHAQPEGDTRFPDLDPADWTELRSDHHPADDRHPHAFTMRVLDRAKSPLTA